MRLLLLLFSFFALYFERNILLGADLYVKKGGKGSECDYSSPCKSIYDANEKVNNYDTVYLQSDLDKEENKISIKNNYIIKPQSVEPYITLPIDSIRGSYNGGVFEIESSLVIYNIKFLIGEGDKTPELYLFYLSGGYIRLENCSFDRAALGKDETHTPLEYSLLYKSSSGSKDGDMHIISCNFTNIELKKSLINNLNGGISYCRFTNITIKGGDGAAIESGENYLAVVGSTFDNCVCENGNGGAIYSNNSGTFILGEFNGKTSFVNCKAKIASGESKSLSNQDEKPKEGYGGAVYLIASNIELLNLTKVEFESDPTKSNTADTDGNCMFVVCNQIRKIWTKENATFMDNIASDSKNYKFTFNDRYYDEIFNLKEFYDGTIKEGPNPLYIMTRGSDAYDCSSVEKACATLSHSLSTVKFHAADIKIVEKITLNEDDQCYGEIKSITSDSGTSEVRINEGYIKCGGDEVTVENLKFILVKYSDDYHAVLSTSCKVNIFKDLSFAPEGNENMFIREFLNVNKGEVTLSNCNFTKIDTASKFSGVAGFSCSSLIVEKCRFENVSNKAYVGGGLGLELCGTFENDDEKEISKKGKFTPSKLSIKNSVFKGCSAPTGGAMYLDFVDIPSSLVISGNTFEDNNATHRPYDGADIIVSSYLLSYVVTSETFSFLKKRDNDDVSCIGHYWSDGYFEVNLVWVVKGLYNQKNLYFGDDGDSDRNCTNNSTDLCSSLYYLESRYAFCNDTVVHFVNYFTLKSHYDFKFITHKVVGDGGDGELRLFGDSYLNIYTKTTFEDLSVRLTSRLYYENGFFYFYCAEHEFSKVNFSSSLDFLGIGSCIFVISYTSKLTFKDCIFSDMKYDSAGKLFGAFIWSDSNTSIYQYLRDLSRLEPELYIEGCTFDKCESEGNGGAIYIPSTAIHLRVGTNGKATTFNGCRANYGGAIYYVQTLFTDYVFENLIFGTGTKNENKAVYNYGNRILVNSKLLEVTDYGKIFPSLKEETKVDHQYDCVFKIEQDESEQIYYSLIDIINGNAKEGKGDKYVGKGGSDEDRNCTNNSGDLCGSFEHAMEQISFDAVNIKVVNEFESEATSLKVKKVNISGENNNSKIVTKSSQLFYDCNSATIRDISIFINSSSSDQSFISTSYGYLTLSSVSFTANSSIDINSSIVSAGHTSTVIMDKCSFTNIIRKSGSSPVYADLSQGGLLEIKGCQFINCKVNDGNGGALTVSLHKGSFTIDKSGDKKTEFKGCAATFDPLYKYIIIWNENGVNFDVNGNGGAIYLTVKSLKPDKLRISGVTFGGTGKGEMNSANCGYDVFLLCYLISIKDIATDDNFPYVSDMGDDYDGFLGVESNSEEIDTDAVVVNIAKAIEESDGFPVWAIILIVVLSVVVIAVIVIIIIIIVCCVCRKKKSSGGKEKSGKEKSGEEKSGEEKSGEEKSGEEKSGEEKSGKKKSGKKKSGKKKSGKEKGGKETKMTEDSEREESSDDSNKK